MRWIGSGRGPPPPRRLRGLFGRGQDVTGEQRGSLPCTVMRSFTWPRVCPAGTRLRASPGLIVTSLTFLSFFFLFYSCALTSEGFQLLPRDGSCE